MSAEHIVLIIFFMLVTGREAAGDSIDSDKEVLIGFRSFLEQGNKVNQGEYNQWDSQAPSPCNWPGISCSGNRVVGINLTNNNIAGNMFGNFSALTELAYLDLSANTISGSLPVDLGNCQNLKILNLSHNMIDGELNLTGLGSLEILDLSVNRLSGEISTSFPLICNSLVVANLSANYFSGEIGRSIDGCMKLEYMYLGANLLTGNLWIGFNKLKEFTVCENRLNDTLPGWIFPGNCSLESLDLSENALAGEIPKEISNCKNLTTLNLWGNYFSGKIPGEIGSISNLQKLFLGNNTLANQIPESLLDLKNLKFLDLSRNHMGGDIPEIFGRLTQVRTLLLHSNDYTGGLFSSGIFRLQNVSTLDLSYNSFSGLLPVEISQMASLKFLFLANNQFSGSIPSEYGNMQTLQALDLSNNQLNGSIPASLGQLTNLLWLMIGNNSLTGEIPPELGNCSSLLWLNLQNNQLSGMMPQELTNIGKNPTPAFLLNREDDLVADSGECSTLKRWIPADYQPFTFVYTLFNMKKCRSLWDKLLKGYAIFSVCIPESNIRVMKISGYIQLSENQLSGQIPPGLGSMDDFSMLHLGGNMFSGTLPVEIGEMSLVVLNVSQNRLSGRVPMLLGNLKCLRNLDLSYNNFSGVFPTSLNNLTDLSSFNVSYNPYISGYIPDTGQLATFDIWSFVGDPLLRLPSFINNSTNSSSAISGWRPIQLKWGALFVFIFLLFAVIVCGLMTAIVCILTKKTTNQPHFLLSDVKSGSYGDSSPWLSDKVKVIRLDKTAFTHADILTATENFSNDRIIGRGGYGTVYRGVLPDGRVVAVKKKLREGIEGEKEFKAEMEVLTGNGFGWPHPNLVPLYGWCLDGSEKLLVYEYMEGGTLEDLLHDRVRFPWRRRIHVAIDVAHALVFLHHECHPPIVHRDVKASNVLLDKKGTARVTDFGLARAVDAGGSHVSTMVAGTIGYVAPEYGQTCKATTKGDVYSYGVLVMELATGRRAVEGGKEYLVEWSRRMMGRRSIILMPLMTSGVADGAVEMRELLRLGVRCTNDTPQSRPDMKEVLDMLLQISVRSKGF
ncbi:hypothetical protein R6Q59_029035 [Mikania micrantha]|uniref:non-specific serine/threonine protein kinase n=1 Tax=Mikania micrantha TaxID=192012 RepID=A0A5N6LWJ7_9ASTR|nr:hypothetical protein E3N88_39355 [Mikania micrantha]